MPASLKLLVFPWSPFCPLSSGIARKRCTSVTAEESVGFSASNLAPVIAEIYYKSAIRSSLDCSRSGSN